MFKTIKCIQEEKFHLEDRFDPKTGLKTEPEKIIDQKEIIKEIYIFDGQECSYHDLLNENIAKKCDCDCYMENIEEDDEIDCVVFSPYQQYNGFMMGSCRDSLYFPKEKLDIIRLMNLQVSSERISKQLNELGIQNDPKDIALHVVQKIT